ncbi:MAG: methyltransferase domain-containing protein [Candidatus Gracilibacteria bacterium]|nr:methyltransferase domain-containing protein [Candidatus Gracilibacteria bacterium]
MIKYYTSKFYLKPIIVENNFGEITLTIYDNLGREIIYTWYNVVEKTTQSTYINKCLLGSFIRKIPKNVLIIGFGGGAFAKFLEDHIENIEITGIEIDEAMIEIAKKEYNIKADDFYIIDANIALEKIISEGKKFDSILIDVYGNNGKIPDYFDEKTFFENIKKVTNNDSVISINFADYNFKEKNTRYDKIHSNLLEIFGKYYSHIFSGGEISGNISGIYNLDKYYSALEYDENFRKNYRAGNIRYNLEIIKDTVLIQKKS